MRLSDTKMFRDIGNLASAGSLHVKTTLSRSFSKSLKRQRGFVVEETGLTPYARTIIHDWQLAVDSHAVVGRLYIFAFEAVHRDCIY